MYFGVVRPKFKLERTEKSVKKFENASGFRCALMNKITSLNLNFNEMYEFSKRFKAFLQIFTLVHF